MNKQEICDYLNEKDIWYEIVSHREVFNMKELSTINLPYKDSDAKNLFVRDNKKNYYLITVKGSKKVDLKKFKECNNTRHLSFANEGELLDILNSKPGSVTPFGLLNDKNLKVKFYIDENFEDDTIIGVHPNENTATVWLKTKDLICLIHQHGNEVHRVSI